MIAALVIGCGEKPPPQAVPRFPQRIITFAPNVTETVFALGQGRRVVGVSAFCDYPPEISAIEKVGGHMNPDLERIARLAPDMILLQGRHEKVSEFAGQRGIPVVHVDMDSLRTIDEGIAAIGDALGSPREAEKIQRTIKSELGAVRDSVEKLPTVRVLVITSRQNHDFSSLYTVGGPSFVSELVAVAGGGNIYADAKEAYLEASKETVVVKAPEVILEFHAGESLSEEEKAKYIADWKQFASLPAVQNSRVYVITESYSLRPGPRAWLTARLLATLLHPETSLRPAEDTPKP